MNKWYCIVFLLLNYTGIYAQIQESMYGDAVKADIKVNYVFSYEEALQKAKASGKPVFFNCFSDWAVPCHAMNQQVFSNQEFGDWLNEHFINLWIEMTSEEGMFLGERYGVKSMPHFLVLDDNGEVIHRLASGVELPEFQHRLACALNAKTSYRGMNEAYSQGKRNKKFLRDYASVLRWAGEGERYNEIADDYFGQLKPSQWSKKENWMIFLDRMKRPDTLLIDYCLTHKNDFLKETDTVTVNNAIVSLYYADAMAWASGGKPYDRAAALDVYSRLQKADIPGSNDIYKLLRIAFLRNAKSYDELIDYLSEHIDQIHGQVAEILDMSLNNLHELTPQERLKVVGYLETRIQGGDDYTRRHYTELIERIKNFKGIVFEELTLEEALNKAAEEEKYVFLDCYTSWCGPCKMMEGQVFSQKVVGEFCNEHFVNIKIDMEKGEGPDVAKRYGVSSFPTMLLLNADGSVRGRLVGSRNVRDFMMMIRRSMNEAYNYAELLKEYEAGERSSEFLGRYYVTMSDAARLTDAGEIARFLPSLKEEERYTPDVWFLYALMAEDVTRDEFLFMTEHWQAFARVVGRETVLHTLQNLVFPVYVDYLSEEKDKEKVQHCREILNRSSLPEGNVLLLLDALTEQYEKADFEALMHLYEQEVRSLSDGQERLNLDALLGILVKKFPEHVQQQALDYMKTALGEVSQQVMQQYAELVDYLSKCMNEK